MRFRELMMQMFRKHQRKRKDSRVKFSKMRGLQLYLKIRYFIEVLFIQKTCIFFIVAVSYDQPCSTLLPGIFEIVGTLITLGQ